MVNPPAAAPGTSPAQPLIARVEEIVRGKREVVEMAIVAVLAGGHLLLEDVPGVGKTTLAAALAGALGGSFRRIQCTSDLLPGDVLGVNVLTPGGSDFLFRPGPLFANVVLADELNRTTPRTQSALLEAMSERRVSVDGVTRELPYPFMVIATQNPHDLHGTYPLPDSQLDRFLLRLSMGYPDRESERAVLRAGGLQREALTPALTPEALAALLDAVEAVQVHAEIEDYLLDLVDRTRVDPRLLRGASTRGAEALYRAARALALVRNRRFVIPEDLRALAVPVLAHRLIPRSEGDAATIVRSILAALPPP